MGEISLHKYITQALCQLLYKICQRASLPGHVPYIIDRSFGGHSPRAGGATFYAGLGLSESIIMALGRWSSIAWKIYIRDNPCVRAALQLAALRRRQ